MTAGVICIVAAIVGGHVTLFGADVPTLGSKRQKALLGAVGAAFLILGLVLLIPGPDVEKVEAALKPKNPVSITWQYTLGVESDAPNGLRFWTAQDSNNWVETFADGLVRSRFTSAGPYFLSHCKGILLRRSDKALIAFVPNNRCHSKDLQAQDVDPNTGVALRDWFTLGQINTASYAPSN